ncbi:MAG: hypothetical protein ACK55E_02435 [Cyanobacteriota bacterium]
MSPGVSEGSLDPASDDGATVRSPMEAHGSYRGADWSPQRLVFHQNLETFAERVGLIVALQSNGKLSQEQAYARIRRMWKDLRASKDELLDGAGKRNGNDG